MVITMDKNQSIEIKKYCLDATVCLSKMLLIYKNNLSEEEFYKVKKDIGMIIVRIHENFLYPIYNIYPDLDHHLNGEVRTD